MRSAVRLEAEARPDRTDEGIDGVSAYPDTKAPSLPRSRQLALDASMDKILRLGASVTAARRAAATRAQNLPIATLFV
jgi:hypothetical protein